MTQKEINKFLANTKVYVAGKSKEIQEKLFSLGYYWWCDGSTDVCYTESPFLFIDTDMTFTKSSNMVYFSDHVNREISAEEILSLELTELDYRPFKDIEECWNEMLKHEPFGWIMGSVKHHLITSVDNIHILLDGKIYYTFEEAFNNHKFADGTPFGIKEG